MSVKRYSVWEDEMFEEKHAINSNNGMVHLMVKHEDYAALEARCAALAAENAGLKSANHIALKILNDDETMVTSLWASSVQEVEVKTPATDAFLAEVRASGVKSLSNAVQSVISERQRQQSVEGWTPKHDDKHDNNELAFAASCYAFHSAAASWDFEDDGTPYNIHPAPKNWPWAPEWWKPTNPRRDLVKAGALILAEIERIDRQEAAQ